MDFFEFVFGEMQGETSKSRKTRGNGARKANIYFHMGFSKTWAWLEALSCSFLEICLKLLDFVFSQRVDIEAAFVLEEGAKTTFSSCKIYSPLVLGYHHSQGVDLSLRSEYGLGHLLEVTRSRSRTWSVLLSQW